jgi:hypothetical protein
VDGVLGFSLGLNVRVTSINLLPVPKTHDDKILVLAFIIGIHSRVALSSSNRTRAFNQVKASHFGEELQVIGAEGLDLGASIQIETAEHVEHFQGLLSPITLLCDLGMG